MALDYKNLLQVANFVPMRIVEPYAWVGHIPFARWLIGQFQPSIFVELGVHSGNSYFSVCQSVKELNLPVECFAIDTWVGEMHAGNYSEDVFIDVTRHNNEHYRKFSTLVRKEFDVAVNDFVDSSINLLHIDGLHTYDAVKHDFETWLPKLAPGAIVLFHDICEKRNDFGVWKLWEELTKQYSHHFAFSHSHGLGIIQLNLHEGIQKISWPLGEFGDASSLKSFFEACGLKIQAKFQINLLEIENNKFRSEVGKYHTLVTNRDQELAKLQEVNRDLDVKISEYHTLVTNRDQELAKLQEVNRDLDVKISEYHTLVTNRDQELAKLQEVNRDLDVKISEYHTLVTNRDRQIGEYHDLVSALRARIDYIEGLIFWRVASKCKRKILFLKRIFKDGKFYLRKYGIIGLNNKILSFIRVHGFKGLLRRIMLGSVAATDHVVPLIFKNYQNYLPSEIQTEDNFFEGIVDVVVPVYKGEVETVKCINSVLDSRNFTQYRLIVVNDLSPSQTISDYLENLCRQKKIKYIKNKKNEGFVYSVNKGMKLSSKNDVILLNSDTEVSDGWIDRLRFHAKKNKLTGTVTPFSNNATLCSFPGVDGTSLLPLNLPLNEVNDAFWRANRGRSIELPTAVGFCMYISRECLRDVGFFDQKAFEKGYGEENDFCMRASRKGWKNLFALDLYVYHSGGVSFGDQANPAKVKATKIILERYPDHDLRIQKYFSQKESDSYRVAAAASLLKESSKPKILFVSHNLGGGTQRHCDDLIENLKDSAHFICLKILPSEQVELSLSIDKIEFCFSIDTKESLGFLCNFLQSCGVERIHIHHLLGGRSFAMRLLIMLGIPFDLSIHDYYLICPRANLSINGRYCGQPNNSDDCVKCLLTEPFAETQDIVTWRFENLWLLQSAQRVICPTNDVAGRIKKYYNGDNIIVVPHEIIPFNSKIKYKKSEKTDDLHIVVIGWLAPHKGLHIVKEAIQLIELEDLPIRITLIGSSLGRLADSHAYKELGPYEDSELDDLIDFVDPHMLWLPSTVPETFSYTLSAAIRSGRPIFATNLGAYGERLVGHPSFELFNVDEDVRNILQHALDFAKKLGA